MSARPRITLGEFIAGLPQHVGHQLGDANVVAAALTEGRLAWAATITWSPGEQPDRAFAEDLAVSLAQQVRHAGAEQLVMVGYGPAGAERATMLGEATAATSAVPDPHLVHVQGTHWRRASLTAPWSWTPPQPLPAVDTTLPEPPVSRAALAEQYAPAAAVEHDGIAPQVASQYEDMPPSERVFVARSALGQLAAGTDRAPELMASLTALVAGDVAVRDAVIAHAIKDPGRVEALVRTYRTAGATHRPAIATAAAATLVATGCPRPAVEAVLAHADDRGTHFRLTSLVRVSLRCGINPNGLREAIGTGDRHLDAADQRWHAARRAAERCEVFAPIHATVRESPTPREPAAAIRVHEQRPPQLER
ncbi:hypothetical protein [Cellulomonas sp. Y8]|uniref:hypothetical protein n=1 Tax=Cellulomonas sp. Y8 TaxID=2591145 RepID=UPI003D737F13